jgi:hypothetical protein
MIKTLLVVGLTVAIAAAEKQLELPTARLTLRALDEAARPIKGATVRMSFEQAFATWGGGRVVPVIGVTSNDGKFTGEGHSLDRKGGQIEKFGYYSSWAESIKFTKIVEGRWHPWNATIDVVLKKVVRPVAMYARFKFEAELPAAEQPVGFDLERCDWVTPHGRGVNNDVVFKLTKRVVSFHDFGAELLLTFSNEGDGIQKMIVDDPKLGLSQLRSAREAPEEAYAASLTLLQGNSEQGGQYGMKNEGENYWYRVRTVLDERRHVVTALYGKIYDGVEWFPVQSRTAKLRFTYYLNPTPNDRGMEFDPKRNLFRNLKDTEQVRAP